MQRAVVLGTGKMAPGIAAGLAAAGWEVAIAGRSEEHAAGAAALASGYAGARVASALAAAEAFAGAALVVETIVEDLAVKHEWLLRVEEWVAVDTILATNTSSLSIASIAGPLAHPERVAGFHFLNPAHLTAVVEVVPGARTDPAVSERLAEIGRAMGKTPIVLRKDVPGMIWNRLQFAVLRECLHLLEEGAADAASIDAAVSDGLAPRWVAAGPLGTADLGGLGTFSLVAEQLFPRLSAATEVPEALLRARDGSGFYAWTPETRAAIEALRADTLGAGRAFAERRRGGAPEPAG